MTMRSAIDEFLTCRRVAFVGVSAEPTDFSHVVFRELIDRGFDVVPVNPDLVEVEGRQAYARVQDIPEPVEAALLMTSPEATERAMRDCVAAGIHRVWLHDGVDPSEDSDARPGVSTLHDITAVSSEYPVMFVDDSAWPDRLHAWGKTMLGRQPN